MANIAKISKGVFKISEWGEVKVDDVLDVHEVTLYISTMDVVDNQKASGTIQSFIKANNKSKNGNQINLCVQR